MPTERTCPETAHWKALLAGALTDEEQAKLVGHLDGCDGCQHALEQVAATAEVSPSALRDLPSEETQPARDLEAVMERLKAPSPDATLTRGDDEIALDFLTASENPQHLGRLGPYEVTSVVGRGGMGVVLKGLDPSLNRVVAIKVLAPELASKATARKRFLREAQAAAAVSHDHVVTIHAVDEAGGLPYLVMQYVSGMSLQEKLDHKGPLELKEILRIGMQVASGLAAAHAQGLIHRDIKPSNILLENGVERVKITEFGLARAVDDASVTQSGIVAGTPQYMAPEQARGEPVDHRADLFSLGSVLYAMCTGHPPFRAEATLSVLRRVSEETPRAIREINPDIPDWLAEVVERLHAKDPAERFQSAAEVAQVLGQRLARLQQPSSGVAEEHGRSDDRRATASEELPRGRGRGLERLECGTRWPQHYWCFASRRWR